MAYDSVLDREMFRPKSKSKGVEDLREFEDPAVAARREQALAMIEAAKQKFDPANYQTLREQDRPGVFRPVAVNMPAQQPTADTATRMQQMAAQGIRPIAMRDGGSLDISGPTMIVPTIPTGGGSYDILGNYTGGNEEPGVEEVPDMTGRTDRRSRPESLPSASQRGRSSGVLQTVSPKKEPEKKSDKKDDSDYPTGIESIKAERQRQREENFNMALIRAGLGMAAGKSSNALANIGEGGIAGLEQFAAAEKADRAFNAEERKYQEDRASRIQRAAELLQEKQLMRETRILDIKTDANSRIDTDIKGLQKEMQAAYDDAQKAQIQIQIDGLLQEKARNERVIQQTLDRLGHKGEDLYGAAPGSTFGVGSIVTQNGVQYRVTGIDQNGRVTSAEPVE